jgi:AcrR family transcriptional regulator
VPSLGEAQRSELERVEDPLLPRRRPLQERSRRRVDAILDALVSLLGERSFDEITTAGIAERAGVPIGSVYHFFPSKEGILAEVAGRKFAAVDSAFATNLARELAHKPWREALEGAVETSVAAYRSDPAYVTVWRATRTSPAFREVASASDEQLARALEALPLLASLPPQRARVLMRTAIHVANSFLDWALEANDQEQADGIVAEMKRVLVAYLGQDLDAASEPEPAPTRSRRQKA